MVFGADHLTLFQEKIEGGCNVSIMGAFWPDYSSYFFVSTGMRNCARGLIYDILRDSGGAVSFHGPSGVVEIESSMRIIHLFGKRKERSKDFSETVSLYLRRTSVESCSAARTVPSSKLKST